MAFQQSFFGPEEPMQARRPGGPGVDPNRAARLKRKQANRDRVVAAGASYARSFGEGYDEDGHLINPHTADMTGKYGIRRVYDDVISPNTGKPRDRRNAGNIGPHDAPVYRKHGVTKEVPLIGSDAVTTMQRAVSPDRVRELSDDPTTGMDPRFPGSTGHHLPLSQQLYVPDPGQAPAHAPVRDVVFNGNHRIAAAVERGEMFTPVRSIERSERARANATWREDYNDFADDRRDRINLMETRMVFGDPTIKRPASRENLNRKHLGLPPGEHWSSQ